MCFNSYILRRHGFGDFLIPALKGVTFSCRIVRGGNFRTVVLCNGCNLTSAVGIKGYCVLIDFPLRPILFITCFCTADCRNRRAGQIFVVIPALEGVPGARHICRECCAHAVGIACDILPVCDRAAVRIQGYGIGRGCPLHRQFRHISRNTAAGFVGIAIAVKPHEVAVCISVRAVQTVGRRRGKLAAGFHDYLNILGAITQRSAAKVKGNDLQSVRIQCVRVQDFKDGAETDDRAGVRSTTVVPAAGRIAPANRTARQAVSCCVLPPGIYILPIFDIAICVVIVTLFCFVQNHIPLIISRGTADILIVGIVKTHRWCTQRIVYAAASIVLAEKQTRGIQVIPTYRMRYIVVRNKQAVLVRGGILVGFIFQ